MIKKIRNIVLLILAVLILLTGIIFTTLYIYRNEAVAFFVKEANKYLETPVEIGKIELDLWSNFPRVSFRLDQVKIYESADVTMEYLCQAEKMLISIDIFNILFKNYEISSLEISNGSIHVGRGPDGEKNYEFIRYNRKVREPGDSTRTAGKPALSMPDIILTGMEIHYLDKQNEVQVDLKTEKLRSNLNLRERQLQINLDGLVPENEIVVRETSYVKDQLIGFESEFTYQLDSQLLQFDKTSMRLNGQVYLIDGEVTMGETKNIDLGITSEKNNIQAIVALLPKNARKKLSEYRSKGHIAFEGIIRGDYSGGKVPWLNADFHCRDVEFYYPGYKNSFRNLNFTGNFNNGADHNLRTSKLVVRNFSGYIDKNEIKGELAIQNFENLSTTLDLSGNIDMASFINTFPVKQIRSGTGDIEFDIKLSGRINDLKNKKPNTVQASGDLSLKNVSFVTSYSPIMFRNFNGHFYFNNLDLAIRGFTGRIGSSDFNLSGSFRNIVSYLFYRDNPIKIIADLESSNMDLNELLTLNFTNKEESEQASDEDSEFHLAISPKLDIDFNCVVDRINFRRFYGNSAAGRLRIRNQIAVVDNLNLNTMGGDLILSGSINATSPVKREFIVDGKMSGLYIDSVFYVFNNFRQQFLVSRHLKGQIYADVNTYFVLDDKLKFYSNTLTSFIEARIIGGELIDFEPMQNLSKYIKEEDLAELHFSELKNDIQIIDKKVIIPEMEIISNAYHIYVSGTHTFNQDIDYHFRIPLDQFRRPDRDARFGDIEENGSGPPSLFLKMTGTATDYEVLFDSKAVKEKIKSDLKEEGNELRNILKKKQEEENQVELEEDEYFDF